MAAHPSVPIIEADTLKGDFNKHDSHWVLDSDCDLVDLGKNAVLTWGLLCCQRLFLQRLKPLHSTPLQAPPYASTHLHTLLHRVKLSRCVRVKCDNMVMPFLAGSGTRKW
ncbi:uncharacterized protein LOC143025945 [Oratosquilla oratoria]|uniref:uncharacterized protein LOC143025945 n=1 Tax=Oratosquilla oratoria TaxID=337810 RepID=UPI003F75D3ED